MTAAMAKVLRGGLSGSSSSSLVAAMSRRVPQEGVAPLLGSSPAAHAAGVSRLMHSGQWRNSMLPGGNGSKLAERKALLFGTRGVLSQEHKIMTTRQGRRFMSDGPLCSEHYYLILTLCGVYGAVTFALMPPIHLPSCQSISRISRRSKCGEK